MQQSFFLAAEYTSSRMSLIAPTHTKRHKSIKDTERSEGREKEQQGGFRWERVSRNVLVYANEQALNLLFDAGDALVVDSVVDERLAEAVELRSRADRVRACARVSTGFRA